MKRFNKRLLGLFLAASVAVTTISPSQIMASEWNDAVNAGTEQPETADGTLPESVETPTDVTEQPEDGIETADVPKTPTGVPEEVPATEAADVPEETIGAEPSDVPEGEATVNEPDNSESANEPSEPGATEAGTSETESGTDNEAEPGNTQMQQGATAGVTADTMPVMNDIMLTADSYDVTQPVIEDFVFEENGQALTAEDTLHFTVSAYDAESGIQSVWISVYSSNGGYSSSVTCTKSEESNLYTGTFSCSELPAGNDFYVDMVRVTDVMGNYVDWKVRDEQYQPIYKFTCSVEQDENVKVSNVHIQTTDADGDGKLSVGDSVTYTADIICEGEEISSTYAEMYCGNSSLMQSLEISYDDTEKKLTVEYTITADTYPGEWYLRGIYIYTNSEKNYYFYYDKSQNPELVFTVEQEDYDTEAPVIESISVDKNGEFVSAGDVITVKIKASDEHLSDTAYACFYPAASNISVSSQDVSLTLNPDTGEYTGTVTIAEDTYPCEWYLSSIYVHDETENGTDWHGSYYGYPWYYRVMAGNTYVENVQDITISFYDFAESLTGYYQISQNEYKNVARRTTLKELGVTLPQPKEIEGLTFLGWADGERIIDEDTELCLNGNESYYLYPRYDKGIVSVNTSYVTKEEDIKSVTVRKLVDKEATYGEVLGMLTISDLPEDAAEEYFTGFELETVSDWSNTETKVGNCASFSTRTSNKGVAHIDTSYLTKDGLIKYKSVKKVVDREATYGDVLGMLTISDLPEDASEEYFTGFELKTVSDDCNMDTKVGESASISARTSDKGVICIDLKYLAGNDNYTYSTYTVIRKVVDREATYGDVLGMLTISDLPENASEECFTGFKLATVSDDSNMDTKVGTSASVSVLAAYSSYSVSCYAYYVGEDGMETEISQRKEFPAGTTVGDILAEQETPSAVDGVEFEKWSASYESEQEISLNSEYIYAYALYNGKTTVGVSYSYHNEDGKALTDRRMLLFDKTMSEDGIEEELRKLEGEIKHFAGLKFSEWEETYRYDSSDKRYKSISFSARYTNCLVRLYYGLSDEWEYFVVDKGAKFTLPTENDKYKNIVWNGYTPGEEITVDGSRTFYSYSYGTQDKEPGNTETPDTPEQPDKPDTETPEQPDTPDVPDTETPEQPDTDTPEQPDNKNLTETEINEVLTAIDNLVSDGAGSENRQVTVDMGSATVVPKEILQAARGKDVDIVLNMGDYSWTIKGQDIAANNLEDIDLEVKLDTDAVPPSLVRMLADGQPARQISLTHNGNFGFKASLGLNLGSQNKGQFGNLYYYDSTGKLVFMDAGKIDDNGNVSLTFSHASDYVIVIGSKQTAPDGGTGWESSWTAPTQTQTEWTDGSQLKSPKTGE